MKKGGIKNFLKKRREFNKIVKGIKSIKIQGAKNIAKRALYAYSLVPTERAKKKLLSIRATEPMMHNVLDRIKEQSYKEILVHFDLSQDRINKYALKLIKNNDVIFTHCHSSTVVNALIYAKKKRKRFEVYNTETRPLFQGRKTSRELRRAGIKVTQFIDSAAMIALTKKQGTKKVNKFFIGADALLKKGAINKVGSGMFAKIAYSNKIPVYILSDSWKYSPKKVKLEERDSSEVWNLSKKSKINIENFAFEFIPKKYIKGIISEFGILSYDGFLKRVGAQ